MGNRLSGLLLRMLGWLLRRGRMGIKLLWGGTSLTERKAAETQVEPIKLTSFAKGFRS